MFIANPKLKNRLLLLLGIVIIGFILLMLFGIGTVDKIKVGSKLYMEIKNNKDLLEEITLLKVDLNEIRALLLTMLAITNRDTLNQLHHKIKELSRNIDTELNKTIDLIKEEEMKTALALAQSTWREFRDTRDNEIIPAIFSKDTAKATELALGIQRQRYDKFIEKTDYVVKAMRLKVERLEEYDNEIVRRNIIYLLLGNTILVLAIIFFCVIYISVNKHIF